MAKPLWTARSLAAGAAIAGFATGLVAAVAGLLTAQDFSRDGNNIFPLAPRELRQNLARAEAALAEQRFSDAVAEIGQVLDTAGSGDYFLGTPGSTDAQVSLKTQALLLLGSMPERGRKMYELQFGADAKAALDAALDAGDLAQLTEVSRRYFHTKAGYEATLLLGRFQLDQGRPLAAALTLKRVADAPNAATQYDPELSVLLATCWLHANQPEAAQQTLHDLKQRLPGARVRLVDREAPLFAKEAEALSWLENIVGGSRSAFSAAAKQWVLYRGDERRNAQSSGGVPLLNFNWKLPTVNDPADEARVAQRLRAFRDADQPLVCALQPLVVGDYAIVRQPESNKLIGVNLKKQGKREWVYPPTDDSPVVQAARQAMQASRTPNAGGRDEELKQRIWEDHAFGQISSDGRQVYVLDDLSYAPMPNVNPPQVWVGRRGQQFPNTSASKPYNLLVALDLQKQGYQVWAVGGLTGDNPALAGAFFLGPPLPVGDQLYALAEFAGEIRLLCLDARTGGLEWKQQLAVMQEEQHHIVWDRNRRLAGASPSLAEGILICPTSAGAVVAVDLATRTLRWGYQFVRNDTSPIYRGGFRGGPMAQVTNNPNGGWIDATATIADGCVVLTPPESQQLHCLDLLTGKARWSPIPRDEMLYVACVHNGKIILVGKNRLKAILLADGKPAWPAELKLSGESAVGRGYYSEQFYYLPVTGQQLCKIDLEAGTIVDRARTETELGNLACFGSELVSISPESVASFVLLGKHLEEQLTERLAANPQDLEALSLKAQVLLQQDKPDESLALLRRACELAPDKPALRALLVKVMMALVRQDYAKHLPLTDELNKLVTDPVQRREVLRWRVLGLVESDRTWDAFTAILELADQELLDAAAGTSNLALQSVDRERNVRADRWLQGQLKRLVERADSETRSRMSAELKQRLERAASSDGAGPLKMFLNLFGFHELGDAARIALIERLLVADAVLEAEVVAGELLDRSDAAVAGAGHFALASIYAKAKRPDLVARVCQELASRFRGVEVQAGQTGEQAARRFLSDEATGALAAAWPIGEVEVKESQPSPLAVQRMPYPLMVTHFYGAAPRGLKVGFDSSRSEITVRSDSGQLVATAQIQSADTTRRMMMPGNASLSAKANGHLVVVNFGSEIAAVDGLRPDRGADSLLWKLDIADIDANNTNVNRYLSPMRSKNPLAANRPIVYDASGKSNLTTGPIQSAGVCFQRGRQLVCVDPLTGQTLWERSSTAQADIPQQADIFGDGELLFVADARLGSKSDEALVLSAVDGRLLGTRKLPPAERRWATCGRRVLSFEEQSGALILRLTDLWDEGRELWMRRVAAGSRGHVLEGEEVAILEPSGQFTVVSLADGKTRFTVPLEAQRSLGWIEVVRSRDQYVLLASQEATAGGGLLQPLQIAMSLQHPGMHGQVFAFSRETGKLQWQSPAFVAHHWLPPDQPVESPLLLFVAARNSNNKTATAVLALDRRTGRSVYEKDIAGAAAFACDITADLGKQAVLLALIGQSSRTITFTFTGKPAPPQPPAQTGEMASHSVAKPAGTVDQSLGMAIEALSRGLDPRMLLPRNEPAR